MSKGISDMRVWKGSGDKENYPKTYDAFPRRTGKQSQIEEQQGETYGETVE